jgi:hypothetical protein
MIGRPLQGEHAYKLSPGLQYSYVFNIRAPEALRGLLGNMGFQVEGEDEVLVAQFPALAPSAEAINLGERAHNVIDMGTLDLT